MTRKLSACVGFIVLLRLMRGVLAMVLCLTPATVATATRYWKNSVVTGSWSNGNNWSATSAIGLDNAGAPIGNDTVNIRPTDGANHTVTYDVGSPLTLTQLNVDLTGAGATTATFSMPMSANNLTSSNEWVGINGRGVFDQSSGTNIIAAGTGFLDVGVFAGSTGTYNLSGTGTLIADTNEYIGDVGTGFFNQTGGTNRLADGGNLFLGYNAIGAGGTYTLSAGDLSQSLGFSGGEYIGYRVAGAFNQSGGSNTMEGSGGLHLGALAGSTGIYTLSAGSCSSNGGEIIGESGTGTFTQTGGEHGVGAGHDIYIGYNANSSGTYNLSGSGSLNAGHDLKIGNSGSGTFNQTGGTNSVALGFVLGNNAGATGTYTLSGSGILTAYSGEIIGGSGTGTFTQTGGTSTFEGTSGVVIGAAAGGSGNFILSGGSATTTDMNVGGLFGFGTGVLTVSGNGVLTVSGVLRAVNDPSNVVNLSGGTINTTVLNLGDAPERLNWTSGTLNLTNNITWDPFPGISTTARSFGSAVALGNNQTLAITGNESLGGIDSFGLTLNSGSAHTVTGTITVNPTGTITQNAGSTLTYTTFTEAGGTVNGTLQNQTTFTYQSGLFNGRLVNHGILSFGSSFVVGNGIESDTTMTVAAGQTLTTNGVGLDNHGLFTVAAGGNLVATSVANQNELVVNGLATATTFTNTVLLHGIGQVTAAVTNAASGDVRVVAGERLRFAGASFTNQGLVEAIGNATSPAEIEFNSPVTNASSTGLITGHNNVLRFNGGLTNQGSVALSIGTSDVFGDIGNSATGKIVVSGGAGATFYDDIVQNGTFRVSKVGSTTSVAVVFGAFSGSGGSTGGGDIFFEGDLRPGNSPATVTYDNNVGFGSGTSLDIELGGTTPGSQFDQVHVTGQLSLGGTLRISLVDLGGGLFAPHSGASFDILDFNPASLVGTFSTLDLPTLAAGLAWNTSQLYTAGVLSVGLPGDFNANGVVDAADYVVWRKGLGPTYSQNDYNVWRANFGHTATGGSGSASGQSQLAAVPEPASLWLGLVAAAFLRAKRKRG